MTTMQAATIRRYGGPEVVQIETLPRPTPGPGDSLIRVLASPVTSGEARIRGLDVPRGFKTILRAVFGWSRPRNPVFGLEFAGEIISSPDHAPGTIVFGQTGLRGGAHAEILCLPKGARLLPNPESLSVTEAAGFFFGGLTAQDFLIRQLALARGDRLLITGASGAVGTAAVQIARNLGADVTALARPVTADLLTQLGANRVIDYRTPGPHGPYDVILDCIGLYTMAQAQALLAPAGRFGLVTATLGQTLGAALRPNRHGPNGAFRITAQPIRDNLAAMHSLLALHRSGGYRPHIGTTLPFDQIATAHAQASARHKRGNTVLILAP
jgi:NADPH:quinone reductase-like Zn-dependent oxidoreductase